MNEGDNYIRRVSVENRILILLSENPGWEDKFDAPEIISQKGIARELSMRQNNVSRALTELSAKGLVNSKSSRIKGLQRKKRIYYLTESGTKTASAVLHDLMGRIVLLNHTGDLWEVTFRDLAKEIRRRDGESHSITKILQMNLDGIEASLTPVTELVNDEISREVFFGRKTELDELERAFFDPGVTLISIVSIAGQGKTSLLREFLKSEKVGGFVSLDMDDWLFPDNILEILSSKLATRGGSRLFDHLTGSAKIDYIRCIELLISDLSSTSTELVMEDLHKATPQAVELLQKIVNKARAGSSGIKIMTTSRRRPPIYTRTDLKLKRGVFEIQLEGLDRISVERLVRSRGSSADVDRIDELAHGNPLAVILLSSIESSRVDEFSSSLGMFIDEEIIDGLDDTERRILKLASMLNIPANERLFLSIEGSNHEIIWHLVTRMLLRQHEDGRIDVHDLLKESISIRLSRREKIEFSEKLIDYYRDRGGYEDLYQALYFLEKSGRRNSYLNLLLEVGDDLIGRGYHGVTRMAMSVDPGELDVSGRISLNLILLDGSLAGRDPEAAREYLSRAVADCGKILRKDRGRESLLMMARILTRQADIARISNAPEEMNWRYREGLAFFQKIGDHRSEIEIRKRMGAALLELGDIEGAGRFLRSLEKTMIEEGMMEDLCEIHHQMGFIEERRGRLSGGLKYYLTSLAESRKYGREDIANSSDHRIGRLYHAVLDDDEAEYFLGRSLAGFTRSFDPRGIEEVLIDMIPQGFGSRKRKIKKHVETVYRAFYEGNFEKDYMNRGGRKEDLILALRSVDMVHSLIRKKEGDGTIYGDYLASFAETAAADSFLNRVVKMDRILSTAGGTYSPDLFFGKAAEVGRSFGNDRLLSVIYLMWGNSIKDAERSIELYNRAADLARESGYDEAAEKAGQLMLTIGK
ncbi:MAG: hypothetical protein ACMUIG_09430 [Thermoplasmatota archaeon]